MSFNRTTYLASMGLISALGFAPQAFGQTTWVDYQFNGGVADPTSSAANITGGTMVHNAALTDTAGNDANFNATTGSTNVRTSGTDVIGAPGTSTDTLALAIANDAYTSFDFTINSGTADLRTLEFDYWMRSFNAANDYSVVFMSSLTGFTAGNELGSASPIGASAPGVQTAIDLTQGGTSSTFLGLAPQTIEFRFYYLDNVETTAERHRVDNIRLTDVQQALFSEWTFDGGGDWGTATNWSSDPDIPGAGSLLDDDVRIGTAISADATINMNVAAQVNSLEFLNPNVITVSGANAITLTGSAELNAGGGDVIVDVDIAGSAGLTKTGGGELNLNGATSYTGDTTIDGGRVRVMSLDAFDNSIGRTVTLNSPGNLVFQGDELGGGASGNLDAVLAGDGDIALSNTLTTETITFDAANTTTGQIDINGGTLVVSHADGLGSASTGLQADRTFINGGSAEGTLEVSGGINITNEYIRIQGRDADNLDPALSSSGNNTLGGNIEIASSGVNGNIEVAAGSTLTLGGSISGNDGTAHSLVFSGDGNTVINGIITDDTIDNATPGNPRVNSTSNDISVVKQGTGTMTINTATSSVNDYWRGDTIIEGGTIEVISDGPSDNGELASATIQVRSGATLDVDHFGFYSAQSGQDISGAGEIHAQTFAAFGDSLVSPGDSIGTLTLKGAGGTGDGNFYLGSDFFDATGARGGLDFELSSSTTTGAGVNDLITGVGNLTLDVQQFDDAFASLNTDSPIELLITAVDGELAGGGAGTYTLIEYSGTLTQSANTSVTFDPQVQGAGEIRQSLAVDLGTSGQVNLVVSGVAGSQTWVGGDATNPSYWDVNTTGNWAGEDSVYYDLDNVTFNDSASSFAVDIQSDVVPASVTFDSSTGNTYTVTGAGISSGDLTLTGDVTVVLANDNNGPSSTGQVNIGSSATLRIGDGVTTGLNVLNNFRPFQIDGSLVMNNASSESLGGTITGSGTLTQNGPGVVYIRGDNSGFDGNIVVNDGTLQPGANAVSSTLGSNVGNTTVNADGRLFLSEHTATYTEDLVLNSGQFTVGGGTAANVDWSGGINIGTAGESRINLNGNTDTFDGLGTRLTNGLTISGNVTGSAGGDLRVQVDGSSTLVVSGNLAHDGALTKTNGGTLELSGTNSYTGDTNVNGGTIALIGGTGLSDTISLDGGEIDVTATTSGELSLASGQTVKLGGDGALVATSTSVSIDTNNDNRIAYDPANPGADTVNIPTYHNRVGIISAGTNVARTVVEWDLSSLVSGFAAITSVDAATVEVLDRSQSVDGTAGAGFTMDMYELTRDFVDSEVTAQFASSGVQWTGFDGTAATAAGTGDQGLLVGSANAVPGTDLVNPIVFADTANLRTAVMNALTGDGEFRVLIRANDETLGAANNFFALDGEEHSNPPALNITVSGTEIVGIGSGTITGDFAMATGSNIEFDLLDTSNFDSLEVTGALTAGGDLTVSQFGSNVFADGDTFDLFDFASATGAFDNITLPTLGSGLEWDTSNLLVTGEIAVATVTAIPGDLNGDGFVGLADLDIILNNWNLAIPPGNPLADPTGDNFVGLADLDIVLNNWNAGTPPAASAIPEPASLALLGLGGLALMRRRA